MGGREDREEGREGEKKEGGEGEKKEGEGRELAFIRRKKLRGEEEEEGEGIAKT